MVTTLEHGITNHDDAEGAIVQSTEVTAKVEKSTVSGMVDGKTQIVRVFDHSETNEFSVTGKGDLTLSPGADVDAGLSLLSGGITFIDSFKYSQKIGEPSDWSYQGEHYPHAE